MGTKSWTVVQFLDDGTFAAVPSRWVQGNICYIPNVPHTELQLCIERCEPVSGCWATHTVKNFRNSTYDNYTEAVWKAKLAKDNNNSDLKSCVEKKETIQNESPKKNVQPLPPKLPKIKEEEKPKPKKEEVPKTNSSLSEAGPSSRVAANQQRIRKTKNNNEVPQNLIQEIRKLKDLIKGTLSSVEKIEKDLLKPSLKPTKQTPGNVLIPWNNEAPKFPINNTEDFRQFELFLDTPIHMKKFSVAISKLRGGNTNDFIKKALNGILDIEFALNFNWSGRSEKEAFKNTNTATVLKRAAEIVGTRSHVETEIAIKQWLYRVPFKINAMRNGESS